MYKKIKSLLIIFSILSFSFNVMAESKRTFTEDEFISVFSGKPKARVVKYLGEADKQEIPFLGEIPLDLDIRIASDGGVPMVVSKPSSPQAKAFLDIADQLIVSEIFA